MICLPTTFVCSGCWGAGCEGCGLPSMCACGERHLDVHEHVDNDGQHWHPDCCPACNEEDE